MAGLLTYGVDKRLPELQEQAVALCSSEKKPLTEAGLSGICTRFPLRHAGEPIALQTYKYFFIWHRLFSNSLACSQKGHTHAFSVQPGVRLRTQPVGLQKQPDRK